MLENANRLTICLEYAVCGVVVIVFYSHGYICWLQLFSTFKR